MFLEQDDISCEAPILLIWKLSARILILIIPTTIEDPKTRTLSTIIILRRKLFNNYQERVFQERALITVTLKAGTFSTDRAY